MCGKVHRPLKSRKFRGNKRTLRQKLGDNFIQTRPVWKLNHLQKPYYNCQNYNIENAKKLVKNSLCLPSSSNLSNESLEKIIVQLSK